MLKAGDVVILSFPGATSTKRRPAVVVSSNMYHAHRPDVILAVVTTNVAAATSPTDHVLQDWKSAGLNSPSAFRAYFAMALPSEVRVIGHVSDRDWQAIQACMRLTFA